MPAVTNAASTSCEERSITTAILYVRRAECQFNLQFGTRQVRILHRLGRKRRCDVIARFSTLAACAAFLVQVCSAADLSGEWVAEVTSAGESQYARVTLHTEGAKLAGAWGTLTVDASVTGDRVQISLGNAGRPAGTLTGIAKGAEISGDGSMPRGRNGG